MTALSGRAAARPRSKHLSPGLAFGINRLADKLALADKLIISPRPSTQVSNEAAIRKLADALGDRLQFHDFFLIRRSGAPILPPTHSWGCTPKVCTCCGGTGHTAVNCPWNKTAWRFHHVASL